MKTDLVLSPFGADPRQMVDAARLADEGGFDTVWTYDHFSGAVVGQQWSRDPLVVLGAIASATSRVRIGVLVANMVNRHPAQLVSAVNTLQALGPGRVACGLGAGAAPGSPFAIEHESIGRVLAGPVERRAQLVESIAAIRAIWRGEESVGTYFTIRGLTAVTDGASPPPIVVGASGHATIRLAAEHADGVNILRQPGLQHAALADRVETARRHAVSASFELSVFDDFDPEHPLGGDPEPLLALGVDRRTLAVAPPYTLEHIERIANNLAPPP